VRADARRPVDAPLDIARKRTPRRSPIACASIIIARATRGCRIAQMTSSVAQVSALIG